MKGRLREIGRLSPGAALPSVLLPSRVVQADNRRRVQQAPRRSPQSRMSRGPTRCANETISKGKPLICSEIRSGECFPRRRILCGIKYRCPKTNNDTTRFDTIYAGFIPCGSASWMKGSADATSHAPDAMSAISSSKPPNSGCSFSRNL